jgi:hypothetical protein
MTLYILESTILALITRMYDPDSGQVIEQLLILK